MGPSGRVASRVRARGPRFLQTPLLLSSSSAFCQKPSREVCGGLQPLTLSLPWRCSTNWRAFQPCGFWRSREVRGALKAPRFAKPRGDNTPQGVAVPELRSRARPGLAIKRGSPRWAHRLARDDYAEFGSARATEPLLNHHPSNLSDRPEMFVEPEDWVPTHHFERALGRVGSRRTS
jgi:hypothetical protein